MLSLISQESHGACIIVPIHIQLKELHLVEGKWPKDGIEI